jgi:rhodanese-related sulfurtransferase
MSTIYLDVRTPEEFAAGQYPGAVNHDVALIAQGVMPDLPKDADIKVYCRSGGRAGMATELMKQAGFQHVENVGGLADLLQ